MIDIDKRFNKENVFQKPGRTNLEKKVFNEFTMSNLQPATEYQAQCAGYVNGNTTDMWTTEFPVFTEGFVSQPKQVDAFPNVVVSFIVGWGSRVRCSALPYPFVMGSGEEAELIAGILEVP